MPHIVVKLWPGEAEQKKQKLADEIVKSVTATLGYVEESTSVAFEEIPSSEWAEKVYRPEILEQSERLYKKPGYSM